MQCERVATGGEIGKMDGFLTLNMMKVPDSADSSFVLEPDCKQQCLILALVVCHGQEA